MTFEAFQQLAYGLLHWTPKVFWNAEPRELHLALAGHITVQREQRQADLQAAYELARWKAALFQTFYLNAHRKKGGSTKLVKPKDIATFSWESTEKAEPTLSPEELRAEIERLDGKFLQSLKEKNDAHHR